jgi:hypothetical protein
VKYTARIRALEARLRPGECRVCMGRAWDMVRVEGDDPVPPAPLCEACGKPRRQFIIHFTDDIDDELAPSQQPAAAPFSHRAPAVEKARAAPEVSKYLEKGPQPDIDGDCNSAVTNTRAVRRSKARTRRRQWYG